MPDALAGEVDAEGDGDATMLGATDGDGLADGAALGEAVGGALG